jgi:beta-mannosidase
MIPEDTEGITQRDDESVLIDVWGVNACVDPVDAAWTVDVFDIATGEKVLDESGQITLRQNQSTRIPSKLDISMHNPANVVISATLKLFSGEIIRAAADWPQPLKYIPFLDRGVKYSVDGERIVLLADKPTKAIVLDVEGNDDSALEWSDNGFDIMPGEVVTVNVKFLNRRKVTVNWYGDN